MVEQRRQSSIFNPTSLDLPPTRARYFSRTRTPARLDLRHRQARHRRTFQNIRPVNATVLSNLLVGRHRHSTTQLWRELLFLPSVPQKAKRCTATASRQVIEFLDLEPYSKAVQAALAFA